MAAKKQTRKQTKRSAKPKRYRSSMIAKLITVIAAALAVVAGVIIFFKVHHITVVGNERYPAQTIVEASGLEIGENLMAINRDAAMVNITTRLPYVDEARISRRMPDTVLIEVVECDSVAWIHSEEGQVWLLSASCKLTEPVTSETQVDLDGLTELQGVLAKSPEAGLQLKLETEEQQNALQIILPALSETGLLTGIRSIDLSRTFDLTMVYTDRFDIRLGGTDQLDYKIRYLDEIINHQLDASKTGTIDLTMEESGTARLIPWS
ncbi:MAG: FtsQ-type POTRA domain-containing protein [Oscillospiraceae bacterium]|nr:FtsQ-type POTRA domain-containing protein [Oscillospiraceae bacterium]